jgi:hypothetical protein
MRLQAIKAGSAAATIRASCMLTDQIGDLVYIRANANGAYKVARANPALRAKMPAVGVIIRKWGYTDCIVQLQGPVLGVYTGLALTTVYTVGDNGRPVDTPPAPAAPGDVRYVQHIGTPLDGAVLDLQPSLHLLVRHA